LGKKEVAFWGDRPHVSSKEKDRKTERLAVKKRVKSRGSRKEKDDI